jgi:phenylpyruvate tautomerase PptA (4-oxalocrotonate tautomerase family)
LPLVEISALPQPASVHIPTVLDRVAHALASAIECDPGVVWATWRPIEPGCYSVRGHVPSTQPQDTHDPIVRVTAFHGRDPEVIARTVEAVGRTLAGCLGLEPANIYVVYDEIAPGRVFIGGAVRR